MNRIIQIGTVGTDAAMVNGSRSGRVYDATGISPTITTPTGGYVIPIIREHNENQIPGASNELQAGCNSRSYGDMPDTTCKSFRGGVYL